jgi:outer membrane lipoprotein-sorting protein
MTQEHRELDREEVALSGYTNGTAYGLPDPQIDTDDPAADARVDEALAVGLGTLRTPRPGFEDDLERRLLDRLAEPARPWWRRAGTSSAQANRPGPGLRRLPRRSLLGLAAATALALAAASLTMPLVGTPEVSAREILEKVQANSENPVLAGVKSFHLTAKMWANHAGKPGAGGSVEMTTEQWFVAPDRMRTESRGKDANGKPIITGMMMKGNDAKHYSTEGVADVFVSFFAAPIGAKPIGGAEGGAATGPAGSPGGPKETVIFEAGAPPPGQPVEGASSGGVAVGSGVRTGPPPPGGPPAEGKPISVGIAVADKEGSNGREPGKPVVYVGDNCPEPKRTGEGTVAGRSVFVIENDLSGCLPPEVPDEMRGKHVRWVDQKTFLPLKLEMYDVKGGLVDRYEVTSIEYDIEIPDKTFTEIPSGTSVREPVMLPIQGDGGVVTPPVKPTTR